ncbi:DUF1496 domain-containing protein [Klebsiella oxytoca]|nr:DUF1496 domain-containing protein [Klebsiella oxytoca]
MKKVLIALLVACAIPSFAFSAEKNGFTNSIQQEIASSQSKQIASSASDSTEETTTEKLNKMVSGDSIVSSSANSSKDSVPAQKNLSKNAQAKPFYPITPRPDATESPTCLYDNSRFSEGAVVPVDKSRVIQCDNKKDSQGRTIAFWKLIK